MCPGVTETHWCASFSLKYVRVGISCCPTLQVGGRDPVFSVGSGSWHLGVILLCFLWPSVQQDQNYHCPHFCPIARLGGLVTDWVRCWQWRVWLFTGTKPLWLVSTLLRLFARCGRSACCAWACSQSFPIIQLTSETYPAVRFSAFATNQHEGLKAKVEAPWAFPVSCSPLGDLGRAQHGGRNTGSLFVSQLWHQPALWA